MPVTHLYHWTCDGVGCTSTASTETRDAIAESWVVIQVESKSEDTYRVCVCPDCIATKKLADICRPTPKDNARP